MTYEYLAPHPAIAKALGAADVPVMVHEDALKDVVNPSGGLEVDRLVDAWAQALAKNPTQLSKTGWALIVGSNHGSQGDWESAAHYFRLGLQMTPRNLALRTRLALALQCRAEPPQLRAAWVEYKEVMDDPRTNFAPGVWLMAAKCAAALGNYQEAVAVLEQFATFLPGDDAFWDLLGEYRERAAGRSSSEGSANKTRRGWERVGSDWERVDYGSRENSLRAVARSV